MLNPHLVRDTNAALAYLTCCTLATVADLAGKKSASKSELARQQSMAQHGVDWLKNLAPEDSYKGTRVYDVITEHGGSVEQWTQQWAYIR